MKYISLTQNKKTIVDNEDYAYLIQWKWRITANGYAVTYEKGKSHKTRQIICMHRLIINAPEDMVVDHKNRDRLDNRKINLRICTQTQNNGNMRGHNRYDCKGVEFVKFNGGGKTLRKKPWRSRLKIAGKRIELGTYVTKEEAIKAYYEGARMHFKEYARAY